MQWGRKNHTFLRQFDILFTSFNSVSSYTNPSAIRLLSGVVASASTFGIFVVSLLKNSRQVGAVFGGLLTITGMLGMLPIFVAGSQNLPPALNTVSLLAPQGWAMRSLSQSLEGDPSSQVLLTFAVLMAISVLLFGNWRVKVQKKIFYRVGYATHFRSHRQRPAAKPA